MIRRLGLLGASGRLGSCLRRLLLNSPDFQLTSALVHKEAQEVGQIAFSDSRGEVRFSSDLDDAISKADIFIDFSRPEASIALCRALSRFSRPVLICTTGFSAEQEEELKNLSGNFPLLLVPNTSLGVFALRKAALLVRDILGGGFDIEISEIHHRHKKDLPSGTALCLAKDLLGDNTNNQIVVRGTQNPRSCPEEIGISSSRGGEVAGEHRVYFLGDSERLELSHVSFGPDLFARGALMMAQKFLGYSPGLFSVDDLLVDPK
jgi:4-hydroxy-tetrahydrodipicolinate reductase